MDCQHSFLFVECRIHKVLALGELHMYRERSLWIGVPLVGADERPQVAHDRQQEVYEPQRMVGDKQ